MLLAISCQQCKIVTSNYYGDKTLVERLKGKQYKYCPMCGQEGTPLDNGMDVRLHQGGYKYGIPPEVYGQLFEMYMDQIREDDGYRRSFHSFYVGLFKTHKLQTIGGSN